ncbi:MAG: transcription-repair coupling factor [Thermonemataceae bacterium]
MKTAQLLQLYHQDSLVKTFLTNLKQQKNIQLKGLVGSLDAIFAALTIQETPDKNLVFVMHDYEEAAYFQQDLQNILEDIAVSLFPITYKRPYEYEEVENANVLMRAEVLNQIDHKAKEGTVIVTYPEALSEKVINKRSLLEHTFSACVGDQLDVNFIRELLVEYDFEATDFVYEAGQFAIRGGIIDIFSFASELPFRIELFGDEVESIRTFDPETQLSVKNVNKIAVVPNVQTKLLHETRESFLDFLPDNTIVWIKNVALTYELVDKCYEKAENSFIQILDSSGQTQVISDPTLLFETRKTFKKSLQRFLCVEFGRNFYLKNTQQVVYEAKPQPSFNKNFNLLVEDLQKSQLARSTNIIASESLQQTQRLQTIFEELDPHLQVQYLPISLRSGFVDKVLQIVCYTDHQIFERYFRYKLKRRKSKGKSLTLKELKSLQPGDFVVHVNYGVGRFAGLEKIEINGKLQEAVRLVYRDDDLLYVNIHALHKISKFAGKEGTPPQISKLGTQEWETKKKRVKRKVRDIAKELISLYAKRRATQGFAFEEDNYLQAELESSFLYVDTPDQAKATEDVKRDMELPHPMDRLVCGDVGFGKTEVAIRAAFKAVNSGKQVAVLVPTTILAMQHYRTFKERLDKLPCNVEYINRFKSTKLIKETITRIAEGKSDILIGTHRILGKDITFKDLGLIIVDEEQKFGVKAKEKLKELRYQVDCLMLTATPIPRTLHFSLMGARDLSIIATPPPNRQPVTTELQTFKKEFIRDAISYEIRRGGQVFFVHNRVGDIESIGNLILQLVPDIRIGIAHGQMDGKLLEKTMMRFIEGEYDVLLSTNIIESGIDIPNANTIIINQAHTFGLSDLHQMRGRVGRSNRKAFCYLLVPSLATLSSDSRKRLQALEEFSDLGDGFRVAMRDLDIRGAGNLLGAEQSGFVNDIGFEMYHKILDEAVQELKENEFKDLFKKELAAQTLKTDCVIETDFQMLIPEEYITSISERLSLYNQLDNTKDEEALATFQTSLVDRFGDLPPEVEDLIKTVRLRWVAESIGFEKLTLKGDKLKGYFPIDNDAYYSSEAFGKVLRYVQAHPKRVQLKDYNKKQFIVVKEVNSIDKATEVLSQMV